MSDNTRILVVDDDESLVHIAKEVLAREGYAVLTAYDGEEGLATAQQEKPSLIILDIEMPKMDGYTVAKHLQEDPTTAAIPILLLTQKRQVEQLPPCNGEYSPPEMELSNKEFVMCKPVTATRLVEQVQCLLRLQ